MDLKVYINYDTEITLTFYTTISNFAKYVFRTNIEAKITGPLFLWFQIRDCKTTATLRNARLSRLKLSGVPVLRKFYINGHSLGNLLTSLGGFTSFCGNRFLVWFGLLFNVSVNNQGQLLKSLNVTFT